MFQETVDLSALFTKSDGHNNSNDNNNDDDGASTSTTIATTITAKLILDCHNVLGEGILYDDRTNTILWTDILQSQFHTLQLNDNENDNPLSTHTVWDLPKKLGSFGLLDQSGQSQQEQQPSISKDHIDTSSSSSSSSLPVLCAWEDGFQLYDIYQQRSISNTSIGEDVNPMKGYSRLNDGRVDPTGTYYICGGYYGNTPKIKMKVFRVYQSQDNESSYQLYHEPILENIEVTNSICWNNDGTIMYFADSPTRQIYGYQYNQKVGTISNQKRQLVHSKVGTTLVGVPDGSCVDSEGYIWNAIWKDGIESSCVQRIHPNTGEVVYTVQMPDTTSQVSCCCFGGNNLDILFITTASESRDPSKEPHAGGLYAVRVPFQGRKESRLRFKY